MQNWSRLESPTHRRSFSFRFRVPPCTSGHLW